MEKNLDFLSSFWGFPALRCAPYHFLFSSIFSTQKSFPSSLLTSFLVFALTSGVFSSWQREMDFSYINGASAVMYHFFCSAIKICSDSFGDIPHPNHF